MASEEKDSDKPKSERTSVSEGRKKQVDKYDLKETLGQGMFGRVKRAVNKEDGTEVAIKVMDRASIRDLNLGPQIKEEIRLMRRINHPNIVRLIEVLASQKTLFIVMELVTGGELMKKIVKEGKFPEVKARKYFRQLVEGLSHCHERGVCHRDLKPENLLLDAQENLKISDFGLAAALYGPAQERQVLRTTCGSPNYVAPEVLLDKGYDGEKVDVWSSGVILYLLLAGFLPFDEVKMVDLFRKIMKAEISYPKEFSPEVKSLLSGIFNPAPDKRMTMAQIQRHPWYREGLDAKEDTKSDEKDKEKNGVFDKDKKHDKMPPPTLPLKRQESNRDHEIIRTLSDGECDGNEYDDEEEDTPTPTGKRATPAPVGSVSQIKENDFLTINSTLQVKPIPGRRPSRRNSGDSKAVSTSSSSSGNEGGEAPKKGKDTKLDMNNKELQGDGIVITGRNGVSSGSSKDDDKEDLSPQPSKMNAFDLINMVGGAAVSRMFRAGDEEEAKKSKFAPNFTQFPSQLQHTREEADAVIITFEKALDKAKRDKDCVSYNSNRKQCVVEAKMASVRGEVELKIQVYEMTPTLRLIEIRKIEGDDNAYFEVYNKLKKLFEITSKQVGEDPSGSGTPKSPARTIPIPKPTSSKDNSPVGSPMMSLTVPSSGSRPNSVPSSPKSDKSPPSSSSDGDKPKKKKKGFGGFMKTLGKKKKDKDADKSSD